MTVITAIKLPTTFLQISGYVFKVHSPHAYEQQNDLLQFFT